MSNGRTSRLYRSLVRDKKIAAFAAGFFRMARCALQPAVCFLRCAAATDHTNAELQKAIGEEILKLKTQDVTDDELQMFKTRTKADLIRGLARVTEV